MGIKMTMKDLMAWPKGMSYEEYELLLLNQRKIASKLRSLSYRIEECEDALSVLSDEIGSDRWTKWNTKLNRYMAQRESLIRANG